MKRFFTITWLLLTLTLSVSSVSCTTDNSIPEQVPPLSPHTPDNTPNTNTPMSNHLKITIGAATFRATLASNATATAFKALLPLTIDMPDMNGNEKYYYLTESLPTASSAPGTIHSGDLMLYGSTCVVLFYETFSTSYSYTRLGRIDNPTGLASALGSGSVRLTIELQ